MNAHYRPTQHAVQRQAHGPARISREEIPEDALSCFCSDADPFGFNAWLMPHETLSRQCLSEGQPFSQDPKPIAMWSPRLRRAMAPMRMSYRTVDAALPVPSSGLAFGTLNGNPHTETLSAVRTHPSRFMALLVVAMTPFIFITGIALIWLGSSAHLISAIKPDMPATRPVQSDQPQRQVSDITKETPLTQLTWLMPLDNPTLPAELAEPIEPALSLPAGRVQQPPFTGPRMQLPKAIATPNSTFAMSAAADPMSVVHELYLVPTLTEPSNNADFVDKDSPSN